MRAILACLLVAGCAPPEPADELVFSRTLGFRHPSIPAGIAAVRAIAADGRLRVEASEDPAVLRDPSRFRVLVFLSTSGDVLEAAEQEAVERWLTPGHGLVGVHAASDTEYNWPAYGRALLGGGAWFLTHPAIQPARVTVEDPSHPATAGLPATITRTDEWYDFRVNPRGKVHVLLRVDEASYTGGTMGVDHPIAWCSDEGARTFYTAMGHTEESYREPELVAHLAGGLRWAAGLVDGACPPN
jgi:type 1 glutamine amidotransferase